MSEKDGGPASEKSLRDEFALKAPSQEIENMVPNAVAQCAAFIGISANEYMGLVDYPKVLAKARYRWADAMLKERAK